MDQSIHDHKVDLILRCIERDMTPQETAAIFRKTAAAIHKKCDEYIAEKTAGGGIIGRLNAAGTAAKNIGLFGLTAMAIPPVSALALGNIAGTQAAKVLTPRNELTPAIYHKVDTMRKLKQETANILERVEEKKRQEKEKANARSVRSLF